MIKVAVASQNPTKLAAVRRAAVEIWPRERVDVKGFITVSSVSDQPMDDQEMITGAYNRAMNAKYHDRNVDFTVGLEGGIRVLPEAWFNLGWVCMLDVETETVGFGATIAHEVPRDIVAMMRDHDMELSDAVTAVYLTDTVNDRDCSGVITDGWLPADRIYAEGVVSAFTALQNKLNQA